MKRWELIGAFETPVEELVPARCWLAIWEQGPISEAAPLRDSGHSIERPYRVAFAAP